MNRYYFTFRLSGKDVNGNPVKEGLGVSRLDIKASTRAIAEKKLRNYFFKSVIVTIVECRAIAIQQ